MTLRPGGLIDKFHLAMLMRNDHVCLIERNVVRRPLPSPIVTPAPAKARLRRVLLNIDTSSAFGRDLIAGIARYSRERGNWSMCCRATSNWTGDGVIAFGIAVVSTEAQPVVLDLNDSSSVGVDDAQVARLAAQHLLERGVRHFAFVGSSFEQRRDHFRRAVERNEKTYCGEFAPNCGADWDAEQERLAAWISNLPKPVGIMACDDAHGLDVLDACRRTNVVVPDDVAVIGADNDATLCDLANPPLSSIDVNAQGVGYEAAALLDRLMEGQSALTRSVKLAPRGVITRRSTDTVAAEDEEVSRAVSYIRERACGGLQVGDVLSHTGMSRASLQQRMKQLLGRTIHQEIQRARLSRAKDLLAMSRLTIKQIARESGFASVQYMTRVFRAETGETPARFRARRAR
jgi:LacI family transcriptional regulator